MLKGEAVVSNGLRAAHSAAVLAKTIHLAFGVEEGMVTLLNAAKGQRREAPLRDPSVRWTFPNDAVPAVALHIFVFPSWMRAAVVRLAVTACGCAISLQCTPSP